MYVCMKELGVFVAIIIRDEGLLSFSNMKAWLVFLILRTLLMKTSGSKRSEFTDSCC